MPRLDGSHEIVAHRGFSARAPENTLAAMRAAKDAGTDAVEWDVRFKDVDVGGHAHHSHALVYFEEARWAYWARVVGSAAPAEVVHASPRPAAAPPRRSHRARACSPPRQGCWRSSPCISADSARIFSSEAVAEWTWV